MTTKGWAELWNTQGLINARCLDVSRIDIMVSNTSYRKILKFV